MARGTAAHRFRHLRLILGNDSVLPRCLRGGGNLGLKALALLRRHAVLLLLDESPLRLRGGLRQWHRRRCDFKDP